MSSVSFSNRGINVNTDRIAASSKRIEAAGRSVERTTDVLPAFRREALFGEESNFVEIDGKRYNLNAPRGTYINILV